MRNHSSGVLEHRAERVAPEVAGARRSGRRRVRVRPVSTGQRGRRGAVASRVRRIRIRVGDSHDDAIAALADRSRDTQVRADERRATSGRGRAERQESRGVEARAAARRKRLLRAVDGPERADGRRLVARHTRPEQAGNRDGGDDADNRDDDQQFDEREALVATNTHNSFLSNWPWLPLFLYGDAAPIERRPSDRLRATAVPARFTRDKP